MQAVAAALRLLPDMRDLFVSLSKAIDIVGPKAHRAPSSSAEGMIQHPLCAAALY